MRCRHFENKKLTWFNSKGIENELHIDLTDDETDITEIQTFKNQIITIQCNAKEITNIDLMYGNILVDSYTITKLNQTLFLKTTLSRAINKIVIENTKYNTLPKVHIWGIKIDDDNYVSSVKGVETDIRQRLSLIKGELWYKIKYGLPLFDKVKSKAIIDNNVLDIITTTPDVTGVINFDSQVNNHIYTATIKITTIYGDIEIEI